MYCPTGSLHQFRVHGHCDLGYRGVRGAAGLRVGIQGRLTGGPCQTRCSRGRAGFSACPGQCHSQRPCQPSADASPVSPTNTMDSGSVYRPAASAALKSRGGDGAQVQEGKAAEAEAYHLRCARPPWSRPVSICGETNSQHGRRLRGNLLSHERLTNAPRLLLPPSPRSHFAPAMSRPTSTVQFEAEGKGHLKNCGFWDTWTQRTGADAARS